MAYVDAVTALSNIMLVDFFFFFVGFTSGIRFSLDVGVAVAVYSLKPIETTMMQKAGLSASLLLQSAFKAQFENGESKL